MISETLCKQKKIRCSNEKGYSVIRNKSLALQKPYIQANPLNSFEWIIIDIDHQNTYFKDIPVTPNIIVYNKHNNKAHYYFKIKAVHNNLESSFKAVEYYNAVKYGLNILLDGDIAFNQQLSKNPLAKDHFRVLEIHNTEYELGELADYCELVPKYTIKQIDNIKDKAEIIGRNQTIFDTVRIQAYRMQEPTLEKIIALTESYNNNLNEPLEWGEVQSISKSIYKYVISPKIKASKEWLTERAKKNNKKSQTVRQEKAQKTKDKAFILFSNKSLKLQTIADKLGISIQHTKRYKSEFKKVSFTNQVVPPISKVGKYFNNKVQTHVDAYLVDTFSLYAEREDTEKIPINTINRLLE